MIALSTSFLKRSKNFTSELKELQNGRYTLDIVLGGSRWDSDLGKRAPDCMLAVKDSKGKIIIRINSWNELGGELPCPADVPTE